MSKENKASGEVASYDIADSAFTVITLSKTIRSGLFIFTQYQELTQAKMPKQL